MAVLQILTVGNARCSPSLRGVPLPERSRTISRTDEDQDAQPQPIFSVETIMQGSFFAFMIEKDMEYTVERLVLRSLCI